MNDVRATDAAPVIDRSRWIRLFGACQVVLGAVAAYQALGGLLFLLWQLFKSGSLDKMELYMFWGGTAQSAAIAAILIWTGSGCIKLKRWANNLTLVISFPWLLLGTASLILGLPSLSERFAQAAATGEPVSRPETLAIILWFMVSLGSHTIFPCILAVFHSRPSVRQTFRVHDPELTWTDACPLPVLGLSFVYAVVAFQCAISAFSGTALFYGKILTGIPAVTLVLGCAGMCVFISLGLYKLRFSAWWTALACNVLAGMSAAISFSIVQVDALYTQMGASSKLIEQVMRFDNLWAQRGRMYTLAALLIVVYQLSLFRWFKDRNVSIE